MNRRKRRNHILVHPAAPKRQIMFPFLAASA
jgi:hypothetical protein